MEHGSRKHGEKMSLIEIKDPVLQHVLQSVRQFGIPDPGPMGQQILLLGDTFYGYRFTAKEFTAVWSAVDQTLHLFDPYGRRLDSSQTSVSPEESPGRQMIGDHPNDTFESRNAA